MTIIINPIDTGAPTPSGSSRLPTLPIVAPSRAQHSSAAWLSAARRARWLSYFSLVWMLAEGVVGLIAGAQAHSTSVIAWAIGSAVEAAAAVIVIVRLTGSNRVSESAEHRAQKWVAGSLFVLVPYIVYEAVSRLASGGEPRRTWLAVGLLGSSLVLMPALGWAKLRLGRALGSGATGGEGTQNLLCAAQAGVGLLGLLLGSAGAGFLDPVAALVIGAVAAREGAKLWRGEACACHAVPGAPPPGCDCC